MNACSICVEPFGEGDTRVLYEGDAAHKECAERRTRVHTFMRALQALSDEHRIWITAFHEGIGLEPFLREDGRRVYDICTVHNMLVPERWHGVKGYSLEADEPKEGEGDGD